MVNSEEKFIFAAFKITIMNTAVLSNGVSYYIPQTDLSFFKELAEKMKWQIIGTAKKSLPTSSKTWVDDFAGKWRDERPTAQIVSDIHAARTINSEVVL